MNWRSRAEEVLYDGESIWETVHVGSGAVVVTSHRLLIFTPDQDGPNYRQVDRPNVDGATVSNTGKTGLLKYAIQALVVGGMLLAGGLLIDFDGLASGFSLDTGTAGGPVSAGGMIGLFQSVLDLLGRLDEALLAIGGLGFALGIILLGIYIWTRKRVLTISVAGDDDITLTAPNEDGSVQRLQDSLRSSTRGSGPRPP